MNNVLLRMKDLEISRREFAKRACEEYGASPSDVVRLFQIGYKKKAAERRDYAFVLIILEIGADDLETYGTHRTTN